MHIVEENRRRRSVFHYFAGGETLSITAAKVAKPKKTIKLGINFSFVQPKSSRKSYRFFGMFHIQ